MFDELMRVGDKVTITIPKENREWGYNPCPDGTEATIIGFSETYYGRLGNLGFKPGVYVNRAWVKVRLPDGKEYSEWSGRLEFVDKAKGRRRLAAFRKLQREQPSNSLNKEFLRELPGTPFWEGDFVHARGHSMITSVFGELPPGRDPDVFQIIGIDYDYLTEQTQVGTKYPAYRISSKLGAGWHTTVREDDMTLVERGPVWKFFHNEPITFGDLKEEAQFFQSLGHTEEVRNPANGLYKWTKDEILDAIRKGVAHGFSMDGGFFGNGPSVSARRFKNEDLGRRVAQATLVGFGLAPA